MLQWQVHAINSERDPGPAIAPETSALIVEPKQQALASLATGRNWALLQHAVSRFGSEEQDIIWRAFATIFSWAIDAASGGFDDGYAVRAAPTVFDYAQAVGTVVPTAIMFLLLFMLWKLCSVSRPLGLSQDSIIIVDVLGEIFVLDLDTFSTWEVSSTAHALHWRPLLLKADIDCLSLDHARFPLASFSRSPWDVVRPKPPLLFG